jgi:Flp pilus assembly protein TadD
VTHAAADLDAQVDRAAVLCELGRADDAVVLLQTTLATYPESPTVWAQLSVAYLHRDHPEAALHAASRASVFAPQAGWALRLVSAAHLQLGNPAEAVATAQRATVLDPTDWTCQHQLATAQLAAGHFAQARRTAVRVAALAPHTPDSYLLLASIARARRRYREAEKHTRRALALDPTDAHAQVDNAVTSLRRYGYLSAHRFADSAARVASAIGENPRDQRLRARLELLLIRMLYTESTLVWLIAYLLYSSHGSHWPPAARTIPAAALAIPLAITIRTVRHLPTAVLSHLLSLVRHRRISAALSLECVAVGAIIFATLAPESTRLVATQIAGATAAAAAITIATHANRIVKRFNRTRTRIFSDTTLRFMSISLWLLAVACGAAAERRIAGAIGAVLFATTGFAIHRYRKRRP